MARVAAACAAIGSGACATSAQALTPLTMPPPRALPPDARTVTLGPSDLDVEADVSAMTSYTLRFRTVRATLAMTPRDIEASRFDIFIDTGSLESSIKVVADIATSADFLDTARFPLARFTSHSLRRRAQSRDLDIFGELELHGKRRRVQVPATVTQGACTISIHSEFSLNRREYGIESSGSLDDIVDDDVAVRIDVRVPRVPLPGGCRPAKAER